MAGGNMYLIAGIAVSSLVIVLIAIAVWLICKHKRNQAGVYKHSQLINNKTPEIKINTVEFTLPQGAFNRQFPWSAGKKANKEPPLIKADENTEGNVDTQLGSIKPSLYCAGDEGDVDLGDDLPPGNNGRVYFSLEYITQSEKLVVSVERIRNLLGRTLALTPSATCDPFIRLYLLPDEKRYLQSKMKRKTRHPTFKETFIFTMSYALLIERTLRITVFDVDRFMRQSVIGHVLYPLADLDITLVTEISRDVEKFSQIACSAGRLQIGLTYFPKMNRVAINIIRGLQIAEADSQTPPDTYVKATYSVLSKVHKVKKSGVHKCSYEPFFNQTLEFKIDSTGLDAACINLEVFQSTSSMKNDRSLGSFVVGGSLCTRGKELEHWESMIQKPQNVAKEWHDLKR